MELISTSEAAQRKGVSRQAIVDAIDRGLIQGQRLSARSIVVKVNKLFNEWEPMKVRQEAARSRWE